MEKFEINTSLQSRKCAAARRERIAASHCIAASKQLSATALVYHVECSIVVRVVCICCPKSTLRSGTHCCKFPQVPQSSSSLSPEAITRKELAITGRYYACSSYVVIVYCPRSRAGCSIPPSTLALMAGIPAVKRASVCLWT